MFASVDSACRFAVRLSVHSSAMQTQFNDIGGEYNERPTVCVRAKASIAMASASCEILREKYDLDFADAPARCWGAFRKRGVVCSGVLFVYRGSPMKMHLGT